MKEKQKPKCDCNIKDLIPVGVDKTSENRILYCKKCEAPISYKNKIKQK